MYNEFFLYSRVGKEATVISWELQIFLVLQTPIE